MRIIGLTGGIGSGKSTVSAYLLGKGYPVVDADKIARDIVAPGEETLDRLVETFGREILTSEGGLDRKQMAALIYEDPEKRTAMNRIMHKKIRQVINSRIEECKEEEGILFVDAPLLFETGFDRDVDETWVVDAEDEIRIQRITERDSLDRSEIQKRIAGQMSREEKLTKADVVLFNSGSRTDLYRQVDALLGGGA